MNDAIRLAIGTLTVLRVPAPRVIDRRVGGRAMVLAPLVGLLLGLLGAAVGLLADLIELAPLAIAVVVVAALALATRAIHLDGLADTADGLGSGRRGADALAVMSKSDIGPFGVVTLLLVLLFQVALLAQIWSAGHGPAAVVIACVASRAVLATLCRRAVPSAKPTGLGAAVASSVGAAGLVAAIGLTAVIVVVTGALDDGAAGALAAVVAAAAGLFVATTFATTCVRRFGGVTGDVLGAGVELAFLAALVVLA